MRNTKAFNNLNVPLLQESGARQHLMRDCFVTKSSTSSGLVSSLTWLQQIKKAHSEDSHDSILNSVRVLLLPLWWSISKQQCKHHKASQFSDCSTKVCFPLGIMPPVDAETSPPPLPAICYIMIFRAMKDFPIFLRSTEAAKEATDNSHLWNTKGNDVGHIRKQIKHKVMPRGMENMIMLMFIQFQLGLMKIVHIFLCRLCSCLHKALYL